MIQIVFKDLESSELVKEVLTNRVHDAIERFPDLENHRIVVTVSRENSPQQAGPDVYGVKLRISGPKMRTVVLEKKASNLYIAAAELSDALLERLNRALDKSRVKKRSQARQVAQADEVKRQQDTA